LHSMLMGGLASMKKKKEDAVERAFEKTFARTATDSGQVRDDHKHVETVVKARSKWMTTKKIALEKLEHNKTLDYDVQVLEGMNHQAMIETCKRYHMKTEGTTEELKARLANLMLRERMRSNAYKKKLAANAAAKVEEAADAIVNQYEMETIMHKEEFAGLHGLDPHEQEAMTKMEMNKSLGNVMQSSAQTRRALGELQAWHESFEPIEPPSTHLLAIEQALAGMQPSDWLEMKEAGHEGQDTVSDKVEKGIDDIRRHAKRVKELEKLIVQMRKHTAENTRKLAALQAQQQRLQGEYERKTEVKDKKQTAVAQTKHEAKVKKEQYEDEKAEWEPKELALDKAEAMLQAEVDALSERQAKDVEALHRKHEEIEARETEKIRAQNEKIMKLHAEELKKHEALKAAKLIELVKEELANEEAEIAGLHEEIRIEEERIEELNKKIKDKVASKLALQGEILRIAQETADARDAEEDAERAAKRDREMWKELEEEREQFEWCVFRYRCRCVGLCLFFLPLTLLPAPCCLCVLGAFCSVGI
jgi:hypothetical protein